MTHNRKQSLSVLYCTLCMTIVAGCSLKICEEGNVVCMDDQDSRTIIYQSDMCEGTRCTVSQPQSCQLYRCQEDRFMPIPSGHCKLGSQMVNGILSCIPLCNEGDIVCAVQDDEKQLDIKQTSTEDEGTVNEAPCQKYKCTQNEYVAIENGYCTEGSRIEKGAISCIPRCEN